jgi:hypothetical protein
MKGKRYTEEQIVRILGEVAGGRSIAETARQYYVRVAPYCSSAIHHNPPEPVESLSIDKPPSPHSKRLLAPSGC